MDFWTYDRAKLLKPTLRTCPRRQLDHYRSITGYTKPLRETQHPRAPHPDRYKQVNKDVDVLAGIVIFRYAHIQDGPQ